MSERLVLMADPRGTARNLQVGRNGALLRALSSDIRKQGRLVVKTHYRLPSQPISQIFMQDEITKLYAKFQDAIEASDMDAAKDAIFEMRKLDKKIAQDMTYEISELVTVDEGRQDADGRYELQ